MVDYIMWSLIGIFIYLAIGYIFICLTGAYEDGFWEEFKVGLFWPILVIIFCICCIYFGWKELYKKSKKYV
jgi:hypothetical protein